MVTYCSSKRWIIIQLTDATVQEKEKKCLIFRKLMFDCKYVVKIFAVINGSTIMYKRSKRLSFGIGQK